jgi:periplasmic protein TonB
MITEEQKEKKNKRIALLTSLGVHGALLLIFFFLMAWRAPNPPLPEYGIELNFGLDDQGGGDVQPDEQPGSEQPTEDEVKPDEAQPQEEVKAEEKIEEPVVSNVESPVVVKEVKKEKKEPVVEKPKEKVAETKPKEEKKEVKEPVTKVTETKKGKNVPSHGDDPGKTGDKGNPQGNPDAKALYGKPGGGGGGDGISLSMSGWAWADQPKTPDLPDNEDGRIIFEIECDESGEIVGITTLERGLSPRAEQLLKEEIRKNSLIRTSSGQVPERSKGKVVFVLKTK